ncbi:calcium channel, voltage-dependent, gamma subunit 6a isoform X2 [Ictalurus punctatus]|nr:calcium channel, voltage-dependent, gamma subunit 6a isoform X2 [Ictalurus punctatus]XP_017336239.1 calcium channel, voltage-dependent, gamma subunit 6a isoform X2 [Ictalurus punctatus]XP_017336241.1 calcium channel, voltage-dependent, gamma subunit 6a isoform X2 [Ictalurus punctatus]XP_017336242.1 calcium channel, voltage-dependent, gamma subunit 6a isoform X2 [Ictalurus punctatus]XP_017336243.1 calcium channel, voltage-dependent, gamma subunit 6a isoform X2 [Ictalurus punctatus]
MLGVQSGGCKRRTRVTSSSLSEQQEGKIKLVFLVATVGITLTLLGVGTEFWVELASSKNLYNNETCLAAYYGLWKSCMKKFWVADVDPERETCGPIDLPGESNCTYFKIYTTGENIVLFHKVPAKNLTVITAMLATFSLFLMVMGALCIIMALNKGVQFFLKPASVCFTLSGLLVFLSIIIFHQSVLSFLASDHSIPLHHELSWSVACMGCAGALLVVAGVLLLLLALPYSSWGKCLPNRNTASS